MKQAKDYYGDLAADARKLKQARLNQYSHAEKINKKPFPITKIILLLCAMGAFLYFKFSASEVKWFFTTLTRSGGIKTIYKQVATGIPSTTGSLTTRINMNDLSSIEASGLTPEEKNAAKAKFEATHVVIGGKYYEKRADNTYFVNGRKMLFINNRGSTPAK